MGMIEGKALPFLHRCPRGKIISVLLCALLLPSALVLSQNGRAKDSAPDSSHINATDLSILGGSVVAAGVVVHFARYEPLWADHYTAFHFHEDFNYALNQDKLLHFYGSFIGGTFAAKGLSWAGFDKRDAVVYGAATSLVFFTFMKIEDGHIDYLGFDRVDELANTLGVAYPVAQYYFPVLNNFTPKISYVASHNAVVAQNQKLPSFLEDHEGQKFWMGVTVHDLLPPSLRQYWPPIIGLAAGYTVRGLNTPRPYHETYLSLDLDLRKMPGDTKFLKQMWEILNYIHLPMPAVRIAPSVVWHGLYF
ncbi:MAG TPA: DUF2279 domain-containing protein [Bacteroidota bacterium]|nr:DUF2279 domain-containing protein [Bacteroidota bacterium]